MSGTKYVLDTNALIAFFKGDKNLQLLIFQPEKFIVSIISVIEYLSFSQLTQSEKDLFFDFISVSEVVDLTMDDEDFIEAVVIIRATYKLKLPDAIIAATALLFKAQLVTNDAAFQKVSSLKILTF